MIYVCVPSHNNAATVGLVLWKVRQLFTSFAREYQLLVTNDGSSDATKEILETYSKVLPMTVITHDERQGYTATLEGLLNQAIRMTDRPRRDCVVLLRADFGISPNVVPELIRRMESGADVVIGETSRRHRGLWERLLHRLSAWLLRPGLSLPGVKDLLSGVVAIRLVTIKRCKGDRKTLLESSGVCSRAELVVRAAAVARQVVSVEIDPADVRKPISPQHPVALALQFFRAGRALKLPRPDTAVHQA